MESIRGTHIRLESRENILNGHLLYNNGEIDETYRGQELFFER